MTDFHVPQFATASVLIAGGTSGTGLATARKFASEGVGKIAIVGRTRENGERAAATLRVEFPTAQIVYIQADLSRPDQAVEAAETAHAAFNAIDILVNSVVGPFLPTLLHRTPMEDVLPMIASQLHGPVLMARAVLPYMRAQRGGVIVSVASDAAKAPTPGEALIGAAMAGIVMFSRALAMEGKRDGIRVHAVTPSLIANTPGYDKAMQDEFSGKLFSKALQMASLGLTLPEDLAELILFLSSPATAKMTGQVISVNGGISA